MEVDRVVRDGGRVGVQMSSEMRDKSDFLVWCVLMHRVILVTIFILLEIHTYTDILHMLVIVIQSLSCVRLFMIPRTVAHQAPLSVGIPKQED